MIDRDLTEERRRLEETVREWGAVIDEATCEIHAPMQADYLPGYRADEPPRCEVPPCDSQTARA